MNALERPILAGKLAIPPLRAGTVVRESLLARLDDALATKLGLVVAQAGCGCSVLILDDYQMVTDRRIQESFEYFPALWTCRSSPS